MAENMKYEGASENERKEMTSCNGNCENVGRYYNHEIAGEICPDGWRLPDSSDIIALGDSSTIHKLYTQFSGIGNEECYWILRSLRSLRMTMLTNDY